MAKSSDTDEIADLRREVADLKHQIALVVAFLDVETRERQGLTERSDSGDLEGHSDIHGPEGRFFEIGPFESSFFTLSRKAVLRSVGRPCFFNKSANASSASSWKSIMRSRASKSRACHVSSSNCTRLPGIYDRAFLVAGLRPSAL
jgi:hypothetical protein